MSFEKHIAPLLKREGGFVNHTADRGGPTNYGITQRVYSAWLSAKGSSWRSVRSLTEEDATQIYLELYWRGGKCDSLPVSIQDIHFDSCVNHGVGRAAKLLQAACGVTQDGSIGPKTMATAKAMLPELLRARYINSRYGFYGSIINRDRTQLAFAAGWMNRMAEFT